MSINSIKVKSNAQCVIWCLILVSILIQKAEAGSCRESALCCNGRDSSCVVQKTPINAIVEDVNEKPCYCDHACLKLGDCCEDFKSHCGGKWSFLFNFISFVGSLILHSSLDVDNERKKKKTFHEFLMQRNENFSS